MKIAVSMGKSALFLAIVPILFTGCASIEFQKLMNEGDQYREDGYFAAAYVRYRKACTVLPGDPRCRKKMEDLRAVLAPKKPKRPSSPKVQTRPTRRPDPPAPQENVTVFTHIIQPGETLSNIAMAYFDTYLTQIYYLPDKEILSNRKVPHQRAKRIGKVSDVIARVNRIDPRHLKSGDRIRIPKIVGLPFIRTMGVIEEMPRNEFSEWLASSLRHAPPPPPLLPPEPATVAEQPTKPVPDRSRSSPPSTRERKLLQEGIRLFEKKAFPEAIDRLQAVIAEDPGNQTARTYLARSHFQLGVDRFLAEQFAHAKESFQSALDYNPSCEECIDYIAQIKGKLVADKLQTGIQHYRAGRYAQAVSDLNEIVSMDPGDATAIEYLYRSHFQLAVDYCRRGDPAARQHLQASRQYLTRCGNCRTIEEEFKLTQNQKGDQYFYNDKFKKAASEWRPVVCIDPDYPNVSEKLKLATQLAEEMGQ